MPPYKILVADDSKEFVATVLAAMRNHLVETAASVEEAKTRLSSDFDAVLLDLVFDEDQPQNLQGLELIPYLREHYPNLPIIVMTNYSSTSATVSAMKLGASDFLNKKELDWIAWKNRIEHYCAQSDTIRQQLQKIQALQKKSLALETRNNDSQLIGISREIELVRQRLQDLAKNSTDITIFLSGETGTGKNLAVKYFRKHSVRQDKPFKEFSILELSETVLESELFGHVKGAFTGAEKDKKGLFEEADGGILFLDEIGDYDLKIQKKIMRFIESKTIMPMGSTKEKKLDIQLIVATNRNLVQLIKEGKFRQDLYYRINVVKIDLPPLRERRQDIRPLSDYFFKHFKIKEKTNLKIISEEAYQKLEHYHWVGNVRELYYAIQSACTRARFANDTILQERYLPEEIRKNDRPADGDAELSLQEKKAILELEAIEAVLNKTNCKKGEAAALLGMNLDRLRYKINHLVSANPQVLAQFPLIQKTYRISDNHRED